jgi:hypothetical protein
MFLRMLPALVPCVYIHTHIITYTCIYVSGGGSCGGGGGGGGGGVREGKYRTLL